MDSSPTPAAAVPAVPTAEERRQAWARALAEIDAILSGDSHHSADGGDGLDPVAAMATAASVVHGHLPYSSWTGFYRLVAPELLRVGPYQGGVGCLEIPFERGVCGAAARQGATQLVPDVHAFPGHIACDAGTRSELVVPVLDAGGSVVAVLDLDSPLPDAFDETDVAGAEAVAARVGRVF